MAETLLQTKVRELIKDNGDREKLFDALRRYQAGQDLSLLMEDLRQILNEPNKLELFDHMRPLVLLHHQIEYSQMMPPVPGVHSRIVRLHRRPGQSLGFAVRGGLEHGVGVFVTDVKPGSQASNQGLLVGDEILGVNGYTITEAIHDDVLHLIKSRDDIVLRVTHIGMLPIKDDRSEVKWRIPDRNSGDFQEPLKTPRDLKIFVDSSGHHSLGCGILSGPVNLPGIFVERVRPGSLAEELSLEPGDQILEVNGTSFLRTTHKEAVLALVSSRQLHITIRKGVGMNLISQIPGLVNSKAKNDVTHISSNQQPERPAAVPTSSAPYESTLTKNATSSAISQNVKRHEPRSSDSVDDHSDRYPGDAIPSLGAPSSALPDVDVASNSNRTSSSSTSSSASSSTDTRCGEDSNDRQPDRNSGSELREEIISRLGSSMKPTPLSGAAAIMQQRKQNNARIPNLLGYGESFQYQENVSNKIYDLFTTDEIAGRSLHSITYDKKLDLGITLEGGLGSPLNGKILVAMVFDDGVAKKSDQMRVGDQLMSINGTKLVDITVTRADTIIEDAAKSSPHTVELVFCPSTLVNEEESMTYF